MDSSDDFLIETDKNIFGVLIRNLIDNAIKYTETGNITISAALENGEYIICISDTGPGMPHEKAFELENGVIIRRTSSTTQIGFKLVYDLVKKMNGKIRVNSTKRGTKVYVYLPVPNNGSAKIIFDDLQ